MECGEIEVIVGAPTLTTVAEALPLAEVSATEVAVMVKLPVVEGAV
jgi:hypothetical protein